MAKKPETINMLLDVDNYYGEHEGRLGPVLIFLAIAATPILLYVYSNYIIPLWLFLPVYIVFVLRMSLVILGKEKMRLAHFKRQLYDEFSAIYSKMRIKTVHEDGCIEHVNGRVGYVTVAYNGTSVDDTVRSQMIEEFLAILSPDGDVDVVIQNITETKALEDRYQGVKLFADSDAAQDFIDIIDYNRSIVYSSSLLTRIVFFTKGRKSEWKDIRDNAKMAVMSGASRAFKEAHVATKEEVMNILSRDVNGYINFEEMLQKKYATHQYYGSKVDYYDDAKKETTTDPDTNNMGFMESFDE